MKFEIVSGFPSRVLSNTEATIDEEGLYPQAVVHVREVL